jgi:hypothetical protein
MRFSYLVALAMVLACGSAIADTTYNVTARNVHISSAQDDAETMARTGVLRHCGRNGGRREGIGYSSSSPDAAVRACCYYGRYRIVERGVARGPRGWYAVLRYAD